MDDRSRGPSGALSPTRPVALIRRLATPIWRRVGVVATLVVPGRRTGTVIRVNLIPVKIDGATYLLSFGGVTEWARNLRASGTADLRYRGATHSFTAIEVEGPERDRVIAKYLAGSGPIKSDFYRLPDSADHPTFRMVPTA
jgi:F420H(2)-dependent quinone reductase